MKPGLSRPKKTTPRQKRPKTLILLYAIDSNLLLLSTDFHTTGRLISTATVKNILYKVHLKARSPLKGVTLTAHHIGGNDWGGLGNTRDGLCDNGVTPSVQTN